MFGRSSNAIKADHEDLPKTRATQQLLKGKSTFRGALLAETAKSPAKAAVLKEEAPKKGAAKKAATPASPSSKKRKAEDEPAAASVRTNPFFEGGLRALFFGALCARSRAFLDLVPLLTPLFQPSLHSYWAYY